MNSIETLLPSCWNSRQLAQLRLDWERGSLNSWRLYRSDNANEMVVLVERSSGYSLNRYLYFLSASQWHVSMDVRDGSLNDALSCFEVMRQL